MDFDAGFDDLTAPAKASSDEECEIVSEPSGPAVRVPLAAATIESAFSLSEAAHLGIAPKSTAKGHSTPRMQQLQAVAKMWGKATGAISVGDLLAPQFVNPDLRKSQVPNLHPNTWDPEGIIRAGWREVGAGHRMRGDIGKTERSLDVTSNQYSRQPSLVPLPRSPRIWI